MASRRQLLDDVAKVATSAAGLVQGAGREAEGLFRQRMERLLDRMDLVPRDEFEAVKAMAAAARAENERLAERVAALEQAIQRKPARASAGKPAKAKTTTRAGTAKAPRKPRKTAKKPA